MATLNKITADVVVLFDEAFRSISEEGISQSRFDLYRSFFECVDEALHLSTNLLLELPYFNDIVRIAVECAITYQVHAFGQAAITSISSLLRLEDTLDYRYEAEKLESSRAQDITDRLLERRNETLGAHVPRLVGGLLVGIMGMAPESLLESIAALFRCLLVKLGTSVCLPIIHGVLYSPECQSKPECTKVTPHLLAILSIEPLPFGPSDFLQQMKHVWGFCQGQNGLEVFSSPAPPCGA